MSRQAQTNEQLILSAVARTPWITISGVQLAVNAARLNKRSPETVAATIRRLIASGVLTAEKGKPKRGRPETTLSLTAF